MRVVWDNEGVGEDIDISAWQCMMEEGHWRHIDLLPQSLDFEGNSDAQHC